MTTADARLGHLALQLESLHDGLLTRADQLDNEAISLEVARSINRPIHVLPTEPGREPGLLRVIASEFRRMAAMIE